ncbi:MAG: efflux RND transporter periplasmic adaptor subunit [Hyphomicrobiaceae bacterium]
MKRLLILLAVVAAVGGGLVATGHISLASRDGGTDQSGKSMTREPALPNVTMVRAQPRDFRETILVTGTLVAREEVMISPEIDGYRLVEVLADEGDRVAKGQVLARLETATLDAQVAQNEASIARTKAAIAQAESQIAQAEARLDEARNALTRAMPLRQSGHLADSVFDQREAAAKTAQAQLVSARDGLKLAQADKEVAEAQLRELTWRRSRTDIKATTDGIVSRRTARIGALAAGAGDPLFRLIANGEIELDAEVPEAQMARLKPGQLASIAIAGLGDATGRVRLVSPEIDRATRLGRVRVLLDTLDKPRVGSFARGSVAVAEGRGLAVPLSAILYQADGTRSVQVIVGDRVETRAVRTGLAAGDSVEITSGLAEGDLIVAKAGTFLRDGERVRGVSDAAAPARGPAATERK